MISRNIIYASLMILLLFLTACNSLSDVGSQLSKEPYISKIEITEDTLAPNDRFKVFFTIDNPAATYFEPHIEVYYDDAIVTINEYNFRRGNRATISEIPSEEDKNFFLEFSVDPTAKEGPSEIRIELYGDEKTKEAFDKDSITIQVSVSASTR